MGPGQEWSLIILCSSTFGHNKWTGGDQRESQDTTGHSPARFYSFQKKLQNPNQKKTQKAQHWFHTKGPKACEAGLILEHTHRICLHNFLDLESFLFSLVRKAVQIYHVK